MTSGEQVALQPALAHVLAQDFHGKPKENGRVSAGNVNTLGEPMDGAWYTHRHYWRMMSDDELARGSGGDTPPSDEGSWTVISAKTVGISPGFVMRDAKGHEYFVKFDPLTNPEMAGASVFCAEEEMMKLQARASGAQRPECHNIGASLYTTFSTLASRNKGLSSAATIRPILVRDVSWSRRGWE